MALFLKVCKFKKSNTAEGLRLATLNPSAVSNIKLSITLNCTKKGKSTIPLLKVGSLK